MRLSPIAARITAQCPSLRQVLPALTDAVPTAVPSAYVLPLSERKTEDTVTRQRSAFEARFGVELRVRNVADAATGGPAAVDLESLREELLAALVGWSPGPGYTPIAHVSGRMVDFDAGLAVWRDEFSVLFSR